MSAAAGPSLTVEDVRKIFAEAGDLPRPRTRFLYGLWCAVGLIAAIAAPIVYMAIGAGLALLTVLHGAENTWMLVPKAGQTPGALVAMVTLYLGGLFLGISMLAFMVKPLVAFTPKFGEPKPVTREEEPVLYAFVDEIAAKLGAPKPHRIFIDLDINAGAGFSGGLLGMVRRRLELTLGLPLVAAMSQRELGGVIAHELGHFRQGTGMRINFLVRSLVGWLGGRVLSQDHWDEWIDRQTREFAPPFSFPFFAVKFGAWLVRRLVSLCVFPLHAIACQLSREREYAADECMGALTGANCLADTLHRLELISISHRAARSDINLSLREGRLPDNWPAMTVSRIADIPHEVILELEKERDSAKTGLSDRHPCDRDRIARADAIDAKGILTTTSPATELFRDFHATARRETIEFYKACLGGAPVNEEMLVATAQITAHREEVHGSVKAQYRYFQRAIHPAMPLPLEDREILPPANPQETGRQMMDARARIEKMAAEAQRLAKNYAKATDEVINASQANVVLEQGIELFPGAFGLPNPTRGAANEKFRNASIRQREAAEGLAEFLRLSNVRLVSALQLLHVPVVQDHLKDQAIDPAAARKLLATVCRIGWGLDFARELHREFILLSTLYQVMRQVGRDEKLVRKIQKQFAGCHNQLVHIRSCFAEDPYPFEHKKAGITVAEFLVPEVPHPYDYAAIVECADEAPERFYLLYYRLLGDLALIGERVEKALRLPPLPDPPDEEEA